VETLRRLQLQYGTAKAETYVGWLKYLLDKISLTTEQVKILPDLTPLDFGKESL
jgi:hypothetical protein